MTALGASKPRRALLNYLRRGTAHTIDELVEVVGLSKNAVRTHLLKMEQQGLIERVQVSASQPGRPPAAFRLGPAAHHVFPKSDGELLTALLTFLKDEGRQDLLEAFFAQMWSLRQQELDEAFESIGGAGRQLEHRLRALEEVLERNKFMPVLSAESGLTIRECNCPYPAAVRATKVPCQLEAQFLGRVVGSEPTSIRLRQNETEPCVFQWAELTTGSSNP